MISDLDVKYQQGVNLSCEGLTEDKGGFTYLRWSHAVRMLKTIFPEAHWTVSQFVDWQALKKFAEGRGDSVVEKMFETDQVPRMPYCVTSAGVFVQVMLYLDRECRHHQELWFPVIDYRNNPIPPEKVTTFDINTSIQRAKVKVIAEASGIGLYIYAGAEDVADFVDDTTAKESAKEELLELATHPGVPTSIREALEKKYSKAFKLSMVEEDSSKLRSKIATWEKENNYKTLGTVDSKSEKEPSEN